MTATSTHNAPKSHNAMKLATEGFSVEHGAAILMVRTNCSLLTAKKAMQRAHAALKIPMHLRLTDGLRKVACDEVKLKLKRATVGESAFTKTAESSLDGGRGLRFHPELSTEAIAAMQDKPFARTFEYVTTPDSWKSAA